MSVNVIMTALLRATSMMSYDVATDAESENPFHRGDTYSEPAKMVYWRGTLNSQ
jgi:hypothetical protein